MRTSERSATPPERWERRRRGRVMHGVAAVSIMLAIVTGACGGGSEEASSDSGNGKGSSASSEKDPQKAFLAYARCRRE